jgi:hypothetical protein
MDIEALLKRHGDVKWCMEPFPHAIVDNFFPQEVFDKISDVSAQDVSDLKRENKSVLELNKKEYGLDGTSDIFRIPVETMGTAGGVAFFAKFIEASKIITLASFENFGGYYPYHRSNRNGLLGAHVDHSNLDKNFHFANSIFYSHKDWDKEWNGETILFNHNGLVPKVYIEPKPNRMIFFIHSNKSFHGVNTILCPEGVTRNTYYMDYYINPIDLPTVQKNAKKMGSKRLLKWTYHPTTFVPFFPLGLKSFHIKGFKSTSGYLVSYVLYLVFSISFFTKLRFKCFSEIRYLKTKFFKK